MYPSQIKSEYDMTKGAINLTWRALFWDIPKMKEATKVGWRE